MKNHTACILKRIDNNSRIALWDNIKFFLITTMVIGHFADPFSDKSDVCKSIFLLIYSFHMPLFIFISGLFHNNKNIVKKCVFYISLAFLSKILLSLFSGKGEAGYSFSLLSDANIPWYLFVMSFYIVICYILRNENKLYIIIAFIILACFIGYDKTIGDYLYISRTIVFFPFYLIGTMLKHDKLLEIKRKNKVLILPAIFVLLIWFYLCFAKLDIVYELRGLFTGRNAFYGVFLQNGILMRLLCYFISSIIGLSIIMIFPAKNIPFISNLGTKTLNVYLWHWPIYLLLDRYIHISDLFSVGFIGKVGYFVCSVLLTLFISHFKLFEFPIKFIKNAIYKKEKSHLS